MFFRTPFILPWFYPELTWRISTNEKKIYLTFDDGPVPDQTEFVLETLKKYNAIATFFCIGDNVHKHPLVFEKIVKQGHSIGNHTFNHIKGWDHSTQDYLHNIALCKEQFSKNGIVNVDTKPLFRPPYGRIRRSQIKSMDDYQIIMWDVLSYDFSNKYSPDNCLQGTIRATRPGSIVVFHDSVKANRNMKYALPHYLDHFSNLGYTFHSL